MPDDSGHSRGDTEHVKRGATKFTDRVIAYGWDGKNDDNINSVWICRECGDELEIRQRRGRHAYVSVGCSCGAESLDLRVSDLFEFKMKAWDTATVAELGRGEFADNRSQQPDTDRSGGGE
jgi:hypothetical protein